MRTLFSEPLQRFWHARAPSLHMAALVFVALVSVYSLSFNGRFISGDERLFVSSAASVGALGEINTGAVYPLYGLATSIEPGQAFISALLYQLTQLPNVGSVQAIFLTNLYATALTALVVLGLARQQGASRGGAVGAALVFGLGTLAWPHAKFYYRDSLAMLCVALSAWHFEAVFSSRTKWLGAVQWGCALLWLVGGVLTKNTALLVLPAFLIMALWRLSRGQQAMALGVFGSSLLAGWFLLTTGVLQRINGLENLATVFTLLRQPLNPYFGEGLVGLLVSPGKGLLVESPALWLAVGAFGWAPAGTRRRYALPWLVLLILALGVARFKDYIWWGGVGWGVRHMLPAVPLLAAACAPALEKLWTTRARVWQGVGGAVLLLSGLIQLGAVAALPSDYYDRLSALGPKAAWTLALWNPRYSEIVGYWQLVLEGRPWDLAAVHVWAVRPLAVSGFVFSLAVGVGLSWWLLQRTLTHSPTRRAWLWLGVALSVWSLSLLPYSLLFTYFPDPYYSASRVNYRAAAAYLAENVRPGDVVVVRGYDHPLWRFFMNHGHLSVPWYALDANAPDAMGLEVIRANLTPQQAFITPTLQLLSETLPARYQRLWLVNDYQAADGMWRLEEWWLTQWAVSVSTVLFPQDGVVSVALFALPANDTPAPTPIPLHLSFGDSLLLRDVVVLPFGESALIYPGAVLPIELIWQATRPLPEVNVGVYVLDLHGALRAQHDGPAAGGFHPTSVWKLGEVVSDRHGLLLPVDMPPGTYTVALAVYDPNTGARLSVPNTADNLAPITEITVSAPP